MLCPYTSHIFLATLGSPTLPHVPTPFPVEELLRKLTDLQSAINTGKDSL